MNYGIKEAMNLKQIMEEFYTLLIEKNRIGKWFKRRFLRACFYQLKSRAEHEYSSRGDDADQRKNLNVLIYIFFLVRFYELTGYVFFCCFSVYCVFFVT